MKTSLKIILFSSLPFISLVVGALACICAVWLKGQSGTDIQNTPRYFIEAFTVIFSVIGIGSGILGYMEYRGNASVSLKALGGMILSVIAIVLIIQML